MAQVYKTFAGQTYLVELGSDGSPRDGMILELRDETDALAMEVYYDDPTGQFSITTGSSGVPLEAAEWLIEEAKHQLPPSADRRKER
jgi:hypothetical protein